MRRILVLSFLLVLVVCAILALRAAGLSSRQLAVAPAELAPVDADAAARRLAQAIRYRTISHFDPSLLDAQAFAAFQDFLARAFPGAHAALARERVAGHTLLYTWRGHGDGEPIALLAHQDVVPVPEGVEASWQEPPWEGVVADGYVWGRGAMDDKGNLLAILEAVEGLVARGFAPRRTVYLAFGHDEEVGGEGAQAVADLLASRGERLAFVVDEGLAVLEGVIPGLARPAALIGIAEKGYLSVRLVVEQPGGHSSTPPPHTAVGILASAIHRLERAPLPARIDGVPRRFFGYVAPELPFGHRVVFANLWLFAPLVERVLARNPGTNAVIRTTTAVTMIQGSPKDNVLPNRAEAVVNFRLLPGDTADVVVRHVREAVADERVAVEALRTPREASPISDPDSPNFALLQRTIGEVFPGAVVAPNLVVGGTDARHYGEVASDVYRFSPYRFVMEDLGRAHGIDERIAVDGHARAIQFYARLLQNAAQ